MPIAHRHLYCTVSHQLCNSANIHPLLNGLAERYVNLGFSKGVSFDHLRSASVAQMVALP